MCPYLVPRPCGTSSRLWPPFGERLRRRSTVPGPNRPRSRKGQVMATYRIPKHHDADVFNQPPLDAPVALPEDGLVCPAATAMPEEGDERYRLLVEQAKDYAILSADAG